MAKTSTDDLLEQFKGMTLLELSDFIKRFEETFDVQAAVAGPVMMAGPAAAGGAEEVASARKLLEELHAEQSLREPDLVPGR